MTFTTRRDTQGDKTVESADFKIWSILAKNHAPLEKSRFLDEIQIFF